MEREQLMEDLLLAYYEARRNKRFEIDASETKFLFRTYATFQNLPATQKDFAWQVAWIFPLRMFGWKINEIYGVEKVFEKWDTVIFENRMAD